MNQSDKGLIESSSDLTLISPLHRTKFIISGNS